jgi:hypothetical protein
MAKRGASSQDALERSPKRTQVIEILTDSESELPNLDFSRFNARRSQRARESTQGQPEIARDSWLVKPEARRVEPEENEREAEPEIGLELMDDHRDAGRQATVESDLGEPNGFAIPDVRHDSSPLMVQSSDPRPPSRTIDTHDTFGGAEPSDVLDHAVDSAHSVSARQTPAPAEAVATKSPTAGAVETHLTDLDHFRSMSDAHNHSCEAGPSNTSNVATASISSSGGRVLPALHDDVRHDSPSLMAQSSDPRPASCTDDTPDNFVDAEPSFYNTTDPIHSSPARTSPAPAEAVTTKSPIEGAVGTHITGPDHSCFMSGARGDSCEAGSSDIPDVATASINSSGARVLPALHETLATGHSMVHEINSITLAPIVAPQSSA